MISATFTPPTIADLPSVLPNTHGPQRRLFRYYGGNPRGVSVLLVSGHYATVENPTTDQVAAAGAEGVGHFLGGHVYVVDSSVAAALTADGFAPYLSNVLVALPAYRANHSASNSNPAGGYTATIPAAVAVGDLMIVSVTIFSSGITIPTPAGWTALGPFSTGVGTNSIKSYTFYRVATAPDTGGAAFYSFGFTSSTPYGGMMVAYSGVALAPINKSAVNVSASDGTTLVSPSVTPDVNGVRVVQLWVTGSVTTPGTVTTPATNRLTVSVSGGFMGMGVSDQSQEVAAATGALNAAANVGSSWVATTLALAGT